MKKFDWFGRVRDAGTATFLGTKPYGQPVFATWSILWGKHDRKRGILTLGVILRAGSFSAPVPIRLQLKNGEELNLTSNSSNPIPGQKQAKLVCYAVKDKIKAIEGRQYDTVKTLPMPGFEEEQL